MKPYLAIIRPGNCVMSVFASLIGSFIILKSLNLTAIVAAMAVFLITGAGNAINDYVDIEADKVNRPKRPIPSGKIKPRTALGYSAILFGVGLLISLYTNWLAFGIALLNIVLLIIYSFYLKQTAFLGNIAVSYLVGSTLLFGSAALIARPDIPSLSVPLILMSLAMLANFSREVVKTLEDLEGDKQDFIKRIITKAKQKILQKFKIQKEGIKSKYSENLTSSIASISMVIAIGLSPLPYILKFFGLSYLLVVLIADLLYIYSIAVIFSKNKKRYSKASKIIKLGMLVGLISYAVGAAF